MSKYIIELNDKCARGIVVFGKTDEGVISTTQYVENLEVLNSDYINEHYGDLQDTAYQRGLEDGKKATWEAVRKVIHLPEGVVLDLFTDCYSSVCTVLQVFLKYEGSEVIEKLKAYEEKQKADEDVKRGDVVRHKINGLTYIVTLANESGYVLLDSDGNFATSCITNSFEKTGKHVDIDKILEGLRYDS